MAIKTAAFAAETSIEEETAVIQLIGEINIEADAAMSAAYDQAEAAAAQKRVWVTTVQRTPT